MIPIMPDEEFQKLSEEEKNAQWDRELDSMTQRTWTGSISTALAVALVIRFPKRSWWTWINSSKIRTFTTDVDFRNTSSRFKGV
jgi:hypothetical protein